MNTPIPGSKWRHYKSTGGLDYTYEVLFIAKHSETNELLVVYHPLYEISGQDWFRETDIVVRPLLIWNESVVHDGIVQPRFSQIL